MQEETFEQAVTEFIEKSKGMIGGKPTEGLPLAPPAPYDRSGPPFVSPLFLDEEAIRRYSYSIGDTNPLFTDQQYAKHTRYGCLIAPCTVLGLIGTSVVHGPRRAQGYPVANMYAGSAFEFYDVVKVGSRFRSSKVTTEVFERPGGARGRLIFLISEMLCWLFHGELLGKTNGTMIMIPRETMGTSRAMNVERLGEGMLYKRGDQGYSAEQVDELVEQLHVEYRRGSEPLYWEDVAVGDTLPAVAFPPYTLQDMRQYYAMNRMRFTPAFEPAYREAKARPAEARTNPITGWPYSPAEDEHTDALLCQYRDLPGPFDAGHQRVQTVQRLLTRWMGDDGFVRKLYAAIRRPLYYGDSPIYSGEVATKYVAVERGEDGPGGVPGEARYGAVGVRIVGINQHGELHCPGTATVYLPSRELGPVQLPIPHSPRPPYVSVSVYSRDWY
ncbi:MAG: MaoC family dehydratase N-terminal domain-containing protein [Chloroflexi bacterium]|nr:MaoC family dehydratase N-terminal domain-containing protein [Chloroflexota bacterium]